MSEVFAQMYHFSLNFDSLQLKFSLTSNYLRTKAVVVKVVGCTPYLTLFLCIYTTAKIEFLKLAQFGKRWSEANTEQD